MDAIVGALGAARRHERRRDAARDREHGPGRVRGRVLLRALALRRGDDPRGEGRPHAWRARASAPTMTLRARGHGARLRPHARWAPPNARLSQGQDRDDRTRARALLEPGDARVRRGRDGLHSGSISSASSWTRSGPAYRGATDDRLARRRVRALAGAGTVSHDHDHDHPHDPIAARRARRRRARSRARDAPRREGRPRTRRAAAADRLARLSHAGRRRAARRTRMGRRGLQAAAARATRAKPPSSSVSTRARHPSSSRWRTPRTCTTWSCARSAPAIRKRFSDRHPTGTRVCRTDLEPSRIRAASCGSSA